MPRHDGLVPMVEELCAVATVSAARLATTIAETLDDSYPRVLRSQAAARAWCTLAEALHAAADPYAALEACERARAALEHEPALVEERASIDLAEGTTLIPLGAFDQARDRLLTARRTFLTLGTADHVARANEALATLVEALPAESIAGAAGRRHG